MRQSGELPAPPPFIPDSRNVFAGDRSTLRGSSFSEGSEGTPQFLELTENPPDPTTVGVLYPTGDSEGWVVYFDYDDSGHVKDDDRDAIDADALLQQFKEGHRYAEWRSGDKVAAYGLTGLIAGGAAVAAAKAGKVIAIAVIAIAGGLWRLVFGRKAAEPNS